MNSLPNLTNLIQQIASNTIESSMPCGIFFGVVTNTEPLEINVEQKMALGREHLILTSLVSYISDDISLNLRKNEKVMLLRVQGGQKFIVLDRLRG